MTIAPDDNSAVLPRRQSADGTDLLLELAGEAGAFGCMKRVVRARREFVDHQRVVSGDEQLDGQQADDLELAPQSLRRARSPRPQWRR